MHLERSDLKLRHEQIPDPFRLSWPAALLDDPSSALSKSQTQALNIIRREKISGLLDESLQLLGGRAKSGGAQPAVSIEIPAEIPEPLARIIHAIGRAAETNQTLWSAIPASKRRELLDYIKPQLIGDEAPLENLQPPQEVWWEKTEQRFKTIEGFPKAQVILNARELTTVLEAELERLKEIARREPSAVKPSRLETPYGPIVLAGTGADQHQGPALLLLDLGGNDVYELDEAQGVRVIIDLGGNDVYRGPGACGIYGIDILIDAQGRDVYSAQDMAQGCGLFGVGILEDQEGDDAYVARAFAQGAGAWGLGLLIDRNGADIYRLGYFGQGAGAPGGLGLLSDASGNDAYIALGHVLDPRGLQENYGPFKQGEVYQSLAQGFGYGWRDLAAGGIGFLLDASGNDAYIADYFAQGGGYWLGWGLLFDGSGNDRYQARRYAQGSGVHYAAGTLLDASGNDQYASWAVSLGSGHDYALGLCWDGAGNDAYATDANAFLQIGASNASAVGLLLDGSGNDQYIASSSGLGFGSWDEKRQSFGIGLLLDAQGDRDAITQTISSRPWTRPQGERGFGRWENKNSDFQPAFEIEKDSTAGYLRDLDKKDAHLKKRLAQAERLDGRSRIAELLAAAASGGRLSLQAKAIIWQNTDESKLPILTTLFNPHNVFSLLHLEELFVMMGQPAFAALAAKARGGTEIERARACYFLAQARTPAAKDIFTAALKDSSWKVRLQGARGLARLAELKHAEKLNDLRRALDPYQKQKIIEWLAREQKIEMLTILSEIGIPKNEWAAFVPGLSQDNPSADQTARAAELLSARASQTQAWLQERIKTLEQTAAEADRLLLGSAADPDRDVRRWAVVGLGWAKHKKLCGIARDILEDADYTVRDAAVAALASLSRDDCPDVAALAEKTSSPRTKALARQALDRGNGAK